MKLLHAAFIVLLPGMLISGAIDVNACGCTDTSATVGTEYKFNIFPPNYNLDVLQTVKDDTNLIYEYVYVGNTIVDTGEDVFISVDLDNDHGSQSDQIVGHLKINGREEDPPQSVNVLAAAGVSSRRVISFTRKEQLPGIYQFEMGTISNTTGATHVFSGSYEVRAVLTQPPTATIITQSPTTIATFIPTTLPATSFAITTPATTTAATAPPSSTATLPAITVPPTTITIPASTAQPTSSTIPTSTAPPYVTIDLNKWHVESYPTMPDEYYYPAAWQVSPDQKSVVELSNSQPSFYYSDFNCMNSTVHIKINPRSMPELDDDYFGFALGFLPGDTANHQAEFLLIDWKNSIPGENLYKDFQSPGAGGSAKVGLSISRVKGTPTPDQYWQHALGSNGEGLTELARGTDYGSKGWAFDKEYDFSFVFTASSLKVYVDGALEMSIVGSFKDGRLALYEFSQEGVVFTPV
jgi:hypothetical protein